MPHTPPPHQPRRRDPALHPLHGCPPLAPPAFSRYPRFGLVPRLSLRFHAPNASLGHSRATPRLSEDVVLSHSDPATGLPVGPRTLRPTPAPDYSPEQVLATVLASVDDDKAEEVVQIDLRGRSDVADYMVICSGRSSRQVASISEKLADRLRAEFRIAAKMEGRETGDWVLIDGGDVIVHVFRPEVRDFYQLEKMWQPMSAHRTPATE